MKRLKVRSPHWKKKIDMLDQEMSAASTDFVKLNQLVTEKEEAENLLEEKDGQMDVFRRSGGKNCGAVEKVKIILIKSYRNSKE